MATDHGKWKFNHTMLRVKDPQRSLEYYKFLGLSQVNKISNPDNKFDLYFLGMWFRGREEAALEKTSSPNLHARIYPPLHLTLSSVRRKRICKFWRTLV
jgi:catechol 2,3-dioxygenase-like lactoylglutathione lyase family enzyme